MATPHRNVPVLRFSEFLGKWVNKKIKSIAPLQRGFDLPTTRIKNGKYPVVYSNGILRTHNEFKVTGPSVVTGRSGTIGQVTFVNTNFWPHNTSLWVTDFCGNDPKFIYYFFIQIRLKKYNAGSSIPTLNRNDVHSIKASIPESLKEQQKIATFISSVDTKIEHLGKKKALLEQYKKGMMQKLFSQEFRFKDEQGNDYLDWEEKTLGEVAKFYSGGTPETTKKQYYTGNIPFIKSGEIAFSSTEQFISDEGLNNSSAKIVKKGDILYALYGATSGEVAVSKINGAINQAVLCIRSDFSHDFIYFYLNFKKDAIVSTYIQGGQGNLSAKIVKFLKINFPSLEEQQKIANFLSAIDKKIDLVAEQLEQARTFKKGLLQQMFI